MIRGISRIVLRMCAYIYFWYSECKWWQIEFKSSITFTSRRDNIEYLLIALTITIARKNRDYVYGIWEYQVIKKAISEWNHIRGVIKVTFGQCIKAMIKVKHQSKIPLHYGKLSHQLSFKNINLKLDHHTGGKWFIHDPEHHKGNQLLSMKHSCWLSWV